MRPLEHLGAGELRAVLAGYRDALRAHREPINRLNVYPVPDGDTGTNMALTLDSVMAELEDAGPDMVSVCTAIAHGSLMGARGNSGVILSQILRGFTTTVRELDLVDGEAFARALQAAAEGAYQAVGRPVEGTILTVVREAAAAAAAAAGHDGAAPLVDVIDAARNEGAASLARTPELLDVLRQAGVVDAGGSGFLLLLDAALEVVDGRPVPRPSPVHAPPSEPSRTPAPASAPVAVQGPRFEVMFLLEADDEAVPGLRAAWDAIGDSIAVVGGEGMWSCHIHTDDIGAAVEAGIEAGRPRQIRVADLAGQVEEEAWVRQASSPQPAPGGAERPAAPAGTAVVVVANGEGLQELFRSLGAAAVVTGGQSMNPSTAELLEAVEATGAERVVVLPNNRNIVAVAEQLDGLSARSVRVVPSRAVPEGLAALLAHDADAGVEENAKAMAAAAAAVVAGEVTQAVRPSTCPAGPITAGDWLGIGPGGIEVVEGDAAAATVALLDVLVGDDHELVTIIQGEEAEADDTTRITSWLAERRPDVEVEVYRGGQPLYPYLLGVE
ncbi:MAG: DAK2 domain-containing protein [Actinobacteria bacterium]|nr:DAK2 domain-containing protein [Actinomycetota bacterium]MBW3641929.1 DAK2 domain-containing protein [Actinomycetota bacterium]